MASSEFDGLLVLDKPPGLTSRDVVNRAQRWFARGTRIGHTGTLDPLATGVLVLCVGTATRLAEYVQQMRKTYTTTIRLGARSDTDDAEGIITATTKDQCPDRSAVAAAVAGFVGEIAQVPPAYSAAKLTGRRAYDLARAGEAVELTARPVQIYGIDVLRYAYPDLDLEVRCGKGTYIRSLARDLGERLGCGGYVQVLRRTSVGPFRTEDAVTLDADRDTARARLLAISAAVSGLPRITVHSHSARRLAQGQTVSEFSAEIDPFEQECAVFSDAGSLVAVARWDSQEGVLRPVKVLVTRGDA